MKRCNRGKDFRILEKNRWHRHDNATCRYVILESNKVSTLLRFTSFPHIDFSEVSFGVIRHYLGGNVDDDGDRCDSYDLCKCKK